MYLPFFHIFLTISDFASLLGFLGFESLFYCVVFFLCGLFIILGHFSIHPFLTNPLSAVGGEGLGGLLPILSGHWARDGIHPGHVAGQPTMYAHTYT